MKKRRFILLEVIIALSLAGMALFWLVKSTSLTLKKQLRAVHQIEAERLMEIAFFNALVRFQAKPTELDEYVLGDGTYSCKVKLRKTSEKTSINDEVFEKFTITASFASLKKKGQFTLLFKSKPI